MPLDYPNAGQWGAAQQGLRLRPSAASELRAPSGAWRFRLELWNASDRYVEIPVEERAYFGTIGVGDAEALWSFPVGKWREKWILLRPGDAVSCKEHVLTDRGRERLRPGPCEVAGRFRRHLTEGPYLSSGPILVTIPGD